MRHVGSPVRIIHDENRPDTNTFGRLTRRSEEIEGFGGVTRNRTVLTLTIPRLTHDALSDADKVIVDNVEYGISGFVERQVSTVIELTV